MRGFGAIVAVELAGGAAAAEVLADRTRLWVHATSLGGVESTLERRRRHAGEPAAVPEGLVRLSVGVEDVEDLWTDLEQALGTLR
jgi:cystathionine gamma-synthase